MLHRIPELNLHARIDSAGSICFAAAKNNRRVIVLNKTRHTYLQSGEIAINRGLSTDHTISGCKSME